MITLEDVRRRAELFRCTDRVQGTDCRVPGPGVMVQDDGRSTRKLAWQVLHGGDLPESTAPACGTEGCVMHLVATDIDEQHELLVAAYMPRQSLADLFRAGRARGWFKGGGGYAP